MKNLYYKNKVTKYGVGNTRLKKILELIGNTKDAKVLDVGCAGGYIGARLKETGNYVVGIEISDKSAEEARKVLNEVYVFDIEQTWPEDITPATFDLAICAEVMEHVFDPAQVLKSVSHVLKPNGEIIITTPNFTAWTNRLKILLGLFEYTDQGLLDFGHIRFFTYAFLKKVLAESGFKILRENHIIFPGKLTRILKYWPSLFASQFVIKAKKL